MITWTLLICLIVGYIAVLSITTLLAQPFRLRLVTLVDEMLEERGWNKDEKSTLEFMAGSCSSSAAGLLLPFAAAYGLAAVVLRGHEDTDPTHLRLENDPRHNKLTILYLLSIAGGSPFAALLSVPFVMLVLVVLAFRGEKPLHQAVDAPLRRVSSTLQTC